MRRTHPVACLCGLWCRAGREGARRCPCGDRGAAVSILEDAELILGHGARLPRMQTTARWLVSLPGSGGAHGASPAAHLCRRYAAVGRERETRCCGGAESAHPAVCAFCCLSSDFHWPSPFSCYPRGGKEKEGLEMGCIRGFFVILRVAFLFVSIFSLMPGWRVWGGVGRREARVRVSFGDEGTGGGVDEALVLELELGVVLIERGAGHAYVCGVCADAGEPRVAVTFDTGRAQSGVQDVLVFDPADGVLSLQHVTVALEAAHGVGLPTSMSLPTGRIVMGKSMSGSPPVYAASYARGHRHAAGAGAGELAPGRSWADVRRVAQAGGGGHARGGWAERFAYISAVGFLDEEQAERRKGVAVAEARAGRSRKRICAWPEFASNAKGE
ncbi:hypothetical protein FB451DRAFT_1377435 [Mycena latifolia]|nr:hypothetical protein FB451DRAFT_1377435 [Mycena latifolia]